MQGFNMGRYVPPDAEGVVSGNQLHRKHALGARAAKQSRGILTVRFEMPFAIWCTTCAPPALIGQGVRFNAEKQKVGAYHSTPVLSFGMRHPACGGWIELRTDPAAAEYVVTAGARRRDTAAGDAAAAAESLVPLVAARRDVELRLARERDDARRSAFAHLERTIEHRAAAAAARERLDELEDASARGWDDPFARNGALRRAFRAGRREREADAAADEALRGRLGLGLELLPAAEEDARRAALVDFGRAAPEDGPVGRVLAQPLFATAPGRGEGKTQGTDGAKRGLRAKKPTAGTMAARAKSSLASEIRGNTRMTKDPFLDGHTKDSPRGPTSIPGLRRKRAKEEEGVAIAPEEPLVPAPSAPGAGCLVAYDSD